MLSPSDLLLDAEHTLLLVCTNDAANSLIGGIQRIGNFTFILALVMQAYGMLLDGLPGFPGYLQ